MPRTIRDITPPQQKTFLRKEISSPLLRSIPRARRFRPLAVGTSVILTTILLSAAFYAFAVYGLKQEASLSAERIKDNLTGAEEAFKELSPGEARASLSAIQQEISTLRDKADRIGLTELAGLWGLFSERARALPQFLSLVNRVSSDAVSLADYLDRLKTNGLSWVLGGQGTALLETLGSVRNALASLSSAATGIKTQGQAVGIEVESESFAPTALNLVKSERFLNTLIAWLNDPKNRHLLVFFQNPSELRPAGGFIGSYAEVELKSGNLESLSVRDIYDPDGQLDQKIVPPKQLQLITPRWGARDANWFFDFKTSARKTIEFLELSKIYRERDVQFDGAIAINVNVVKSFIDLVGAIDLNEYNLIITGDTFLETIQREVESGADKYVRGRPKRILEVLLPLLLERLGNLSDEQKHALVQAIRDHFTRKDILIYFKDPVIQSYLADFGATGEVAELPKSFRGEYLAVVSANIGGGKSDAFTDRSVGVASHIGADGRINTSITLTYLHQGGERPESWYRAPNRSFTKIFARRGSRLVSASGFSIRDIPDPIDYAGYKTDPDLAALEETLRVHEEWGTAEYQESGKTVFGGWLTVPPGGRRQATLEYVSGDRFPLEEGTSYQFIYQNQSGTENRLEVTIDAPPGFRWHENQSTAFTYTEERAPANLVLTLTLESYKPGL